MTPRECKTPTSCGHPTCGCDAPDGGLKLALTLAEDDLTELAEYFADLGDIDNEGGPDEEMQLGQAVHRIRQLHQRIIAGKSPLPHHGYTALGAEGR